MFSFFRRRKVRPFFFSAAIYERDRRVFLNPYARTRDGVRTGMAVVLTSHVDHPTDVGEKLLNALSLCVDNIRDSYNGEPSPAVAALLKASRLRSWRSFHLSTRELDVFQDGKGEMIEITPMRKVGRWSEPIREKTNLVPPQPELLGAAVVKALAACE